MKVEANGPCSPAGAEKQFDSTLADSPVWTTPAWLSRDRALKATLPTGIRLRLDGYDARLAYFLVAGGILGEHRGIPPVARLRMKRQIVVIGSAACVTVAIVSEFERQARERRRRRVHAPILPIKVNGTDSAQARA